jgi:hypothetical protein
MRPLSAAAMIGSSVPAVVVFDAAGAVDASARGVEFAELHDAAINTAVRAAPKLTRCFGIR